MTVATKIFFASKNAESVQTVQYTVPVSPASTRDIIDKFTATNTTAGALTFTVNLIPNAGSVATSNQIVQVNLTAAQCYTFPELIGQALGPGEVISTLASGSGITIRCNGREIVS